MAVGGDCVCAVPQLAATRDFRSDACGEFVRSNMVAPRMIHAIEVQAKMKVNAAMRLVTILSLVKVLGKERGTSGTVGDSVAKKELTRKTDLESRVLAHARAEAPTRERLRNVSSLAV